MNDRDKCLSQQSHLDLVIPNDVNEGRDKNQPYILQFYIDFNLLDAIPIHSGLRVNSSGAEFSGSMFRVCPFVVQFFKAHSLFFVVRAA